MGLSGKIHERVESRERVEKQLYSYSKIRIISSFFVAFFIEGATLLGKCVKSFACKIIVE